MHAGSLPQVAPSVADVGCTPRAAYHPQVMPPYEVINLQVTALNKYSLVWLNNVPILHGAGNAPPQTLGAGFAKFVVVYSNNMGLGSISILMGVNSTSYTAVPMSRVYPVQPGGVTPVAVRVMNSVSAAPAQPLCPETTVSAAPATAANTTAAALEPTSVSVPAGTCGYVYSSHRTPALVSAMGLAASASSTAGLGPSGISLPSPGQLQVGAVCLGHPRARVCGLAEGAAGQLPKQSCPLPTATYATVRRTGLVKGSTVPRRITIVPCAACIAAKLALRCPGGAHTLRDAFMPP